VVFFERDVPYYAAHRDLVELPGGELILYTDWTDIAISAKRHLSNADVGMVTSYCPDAIVASQLVLDSSVGVRCFYDLDTPITLERLERGLTVDYIGPRGLRDFDLVLSYVGGDALSKLRDMLGAVAVAPLFGSVDPSLHFPVQPRDSYRAALSYLGTWAADRQKRLEELFVAPAKCLTDRRFIIGGSMYDGTFPWLPNIFFMNHVPVADHPAFYCSSLLNLNVTRQAMADNGYCPSGRLFEAAACGAAIISDEWEGLNTFFEPCVEILIAREAQDVISALQRSPAELARIGQAARERTLEQHTADVRAIEMENIMNSFRNLRVEVS
jgi:spore maturation protein CgeB